MGGSSSDSTSTSTSTTTQEIKTTNQQASATGNIAPVFQGQQVSYIASNDFTPEVAAQFSNLTNLTGEAGRKALDVVSSTFAGLLSLSNKVIDVAEHTGEAALAKVSETNIAAANPEFAAVQKYIPFAIIGFVGLIAVLLYRGK